MENLGEIIMVFAICVCQNREISKSYVAVGVFTIVDVCNNEEY